jgi:hypothetical protein
MILKILILMVFLTNTASNYKFTVPSGKAGTYSLTAKIWVSANGAAQLQNYFVEIR